MILCYLYKMYQLYKKNAENSICTLLHINLKQSEQWQFVQNLEIYQYKRLFDLLNYF